MLLISGNGDVMIRNDISALYAFLLARIMAQANSRDGAALKSFVPPIKNKEKEFYVRWCFAMV